ncbi:MAG: hypothetical protein CBB71_00455 [Rhodopirellula sp. TMED11]|nr:MAG: hypothetical protein CBB71_00455 [Rhodopirellula sp. TMED11]
MSRLLIVGWEGSDWDFMQQLVDAGKMPVLSEFFESGTIGRLRNIPPFNSESTWSSIATGQTADKHRVLGERSASSSQAFKYIDPIWRLLAYKQLKCNVVGWQCKCDKAEGGLTFVSEQHANVSERALSNRDSLCPNMYYPESLFAHMQQFRVSPAEIEGELIGMFVNGWLDALEDSRLDQIATGIAKTLSIQAAATSLLSDSDWDFTAIRYRGLKYLSERFFDSCVLKSASVADEDVNHFGQVMESTYRFYDQMLGGVLQSVSAADHVIIISDHGYWQQQPGSARPSTSGWLAMRGPSVQEDQIVHAASVLDVAPTALRLLNVNVSTGGPGRVLTDALTGKVTSEPQDQTEISRSSPCAITAESDLLASDQDLLQRHRDLRNLLLAEPTKKRFMEMEHSRQELWNLGLAYQATASWSRVFVIANALHQDMPENVRYTQMRAEALMRLGDPKAALRSINSSFDYETDLPRSFAIKAESQFVLGQGAASMQTIEEGLARFPNDEELLGRLGLILHELKDWKRVEKICHRILKLNSKNWIAWLGKSSCDLRSRDYQAALTSAERSLLLWYKNPLSHYNLGLACLRLGNAKRAEQSFQTALKQMPQLSGAHRMLEYIYRSRGDEARANSQRLLRLSTQLQ